MIDQYIDEECARSVCKIGQGAACCRYLLLGPLGWNCAKGTTLRRHLDEAVAMRRMVARGDNCEGRKTR